MQMKNCGNDDVGFDVEKYSAVVVAIKLNS
jgi:hypothetical protein